MVNLVLELYSSGTSKADGNSEITQVEADRYSIASCLQCGLASQKQQTHTALLLIECETRWA